MIVTTYLRYDRLGEYRDVRVVSTCEEHALDVFAELKADEYAERIRVHGANGVLLASCDKEDA